MSKRKTITKKEYLDAVHDLLNQTIMTLATETPDEFEQVRKVEAVALFFEGVSRIHAYAASNRLTIKTITKYRCEDLILEKHNFKHSHDILYWTHLQMNTGQSHNPLFAFSGLSRSNLEQACSTLMQNFKKGVVYCAEMSEEEKTAISEIAAKEQQAPYHKLGLTDVDQRAIATGWALRCPDCGVMLQNEYAKSTVSNGKLDIKIKSVMGDYPTCVKAMPDSIWVDFTSGKIIANDYIRTRNSLHVVDQLVQQMLNTECSQQSIAAVKSLIVEGALTPNVPIMSDNKRANVNTLAGYLQQVVGMSAMNIATNFVGSEGCRIWKTHNMIVCSSTRHKWEREDLTYVGCTSSSLWWIHLMDVQQWINLDKIVQAISKQGKPVDATQWANTWTPIPNKDAQSSDIKNLFENEDIITFDVEPGRYRVFIKEMGFQSPCDIEEVAELMKSRGNLTVLYKVE